MSSKKKKALIRTRGMGLSIKLFKYEGLTLAPAKIASALKKIPYKPTPKNKIAKGFSKSAEKIPGQCPRGFNLSC